METQTNATSHHLNDFVDWLIRNKRVCFRQRVRSFTEFLDGIRLACASSYGRQVVSAPDRKVMVEDTLIHTLRPMLFFASNNYLGLANHPYVAKKVKQAIDTYGTGVGGPPLLNGYTKLMHEVEERISHLKNKESTMLFSSGFSANLGFSALAQKHDSFLYDEYSHASFYDAIAQTKAQSLTFAHNNANALEECLSRVSHKSGTRFVGVEGIYSMNGDIAPLRQIVDSCKKHNAILIVDDAHGTGVLGKYGAGTANQLGCEKEVDIIMGTFSKAFAVTGGFISASREIIEYLRYFARPYIFSAALPPMVLAAVLAGLEIMEREPWLQEQLHCNVKLATHKLRPYGVLAEPAGGIIALQAPAWMDIREACQLFHEQGIFLNPIEYPAVPLNEQRFRISIMAQHTEADIEMLAEAVETVWNSRKLRIDANEKTEAILPVI